MKRLLAVFLLLPQLAFAQMPGSFADLIAKLQPAVVNISTTQKVKTGGVQMFGLNPNDPNSERLRGMLEQFGMQLPPQMRVVPQEREVTSLGSGFIIDASGFVITNNHVVEQADEITVTLPNDSKYKAKVIGKDKKTDLALLKIESKTPLPYVPLGDSDKVRVGDWVIAIGNPYGLGGSVTQGIISARQRSLNAGPYDDFLQTDASINRGNSGGPLFNTNGEVIGINSAIFSPSGGNIGIGFAIPTNLAKPIVDQLKQHGRTHRAWLGVKIQEVSDELADSMGMPRAYGALVGEITPQSPAAKAGVQLGDVITSFDGKEITEMRFLPRLVAEAPINKTVEVQLWRKGKLVKVNVKMEELDEKDAEADAPKATGKKDQPSPSGVEKLLGIEMAPLTPQLRERFRIKPEIKGLLVVGVEAGSDPAKRGLDGGDIITEAGGEAVADIAGMKAAIANAKKAGRKYLLLKVQRGESAAFIPVPVS